MPQETPRVRDRFLDIVFPSDRSELDGMYMTLEVIKYRYKLRNHDNRQKKVVGAIRLPLPPNLGTAYKANYNNEPLGVVGNAVAGTLNEYTIGGFKAAVEKAMDQRGKDLLGGAGNLAIQYLEQNGVAGLVGLGNSNRGGLLQGSLGGLNAGLGIARNPHEAVLFKGPTFRTHNFNYKLVPRNHVDTESIYEIIFQLKRAMLPRYIRADHFFDYPYMFDISFSPSARSFLFDIGPSFLTSMNVNYHGEGLAQYVEYGPSSSTRAPLSTTLSLSFLESTITTRDDIDHPTEGR